MSEEKQNAGDLRATEQRKLGIRLAKAATAPQTQAAIKDTDSCYSDILNAAASEVGHDQLVSTILDNDEPTWAQYTLDNVAGLSTSHRESLEAKASVIIGDASSLELYLAPGVAFEAKFTMFWRNPGGIYTLPNAATPDSNQWKWSIQLSVSINRQYTINCADFAIANAPVTPGATVWMAVQVIGASLHQLTNYSFTYNPEGPNRQINTWGVVNTPKFCLVGHDC